MKLEVLAKKALEILQSNYNLPKSGFLAGGSLANTIWELKSGNKAVINDIDIFVFDGKLDTEMNKEDSLYQFKDHDIKYYEEYTGISWNYHTKNFYSIVSSEKDGIFNIIKYKGSNDNPYMVLSSFDINATAVGYSIDEDKFYWTSDFEEFIKTGELKISNIQTPAHSAIRIVKKSKELNVNLNEFELKLISYCLNRHFYDLNRLRFKERYFELYNQNKDILEKYFEIQRDHDIETFLKIEKNIETELYYLRNTNFFRREIKSDGDPLDIFSENIFNDNNLDSIYTAKDFIFYIRNIYNTDFKDVWSKVYFFYNDVEYIDTEVSKDDLNLLHRLCIYAPNSIENLKGMKISKQIYLVKKLLDIYKEDPIIAISLLEKKNTNLNDDLDDEYNQLLYELSVRREIVNDTKNKVVSILGGHEKSEI